MDELINTFIQTKSRSLARRYNLAPDDLRQDGFVFIFEYQARFPHYHIFQYLKALNWFYSNVSRKWRTRRRREVPIDDVPEHHLSYDVADTLLDDLDANSAAKNLSTASAYVVYALKKGISIAQIKETLGVSKKQWTKLTKLLKEGR